MRFITSILLMSLLAATVPALAQDPPVSVDEETVEDGEPICVAIGQRWIGNFTEIKEIESVPKRYLESDKAIDSKVPCAFGFMPGGFINWHGRYGTEQSALAAVSYMEQRRGRIFGSTAANITTLKQELRRARKFGEWNETNKADYEKHFRAINVPFGELEGGVGFGNDIMFVAERFSSTELRNRAAHWLSEYDRLLQMLPEVATGDDLSPAEHNYAMPLKNFAQSGVVAELLRLRIALFDAQRDKSKLSDYVALVVQADRPEYKKLGHYVYTGDDFCDLPDYAPDAIKSACSDDDSSFQSRALNYYYFRAMADLLKGTTREFSDGEFLTLYARNQLDNGGWDIRWRAGDPREAMVKRARALANLNTPQTPNDGTVSDLSRMDYGLQGLVELTDSINPVDDPVLYRQLANEALIWDAKISAAYALQGEARPDRISTKLDYYRLVLPNLDAVVSGEYKPTQ